MIDLNEEYVDHVTVHLWCATKGAPTPTWLQSPIGARVWALIAPGCDNAAAFSGPTEAAAIRSALQNGWHQNQRTGEYHCPRCHEEIAYFDGLGATA